MSRARTIGLALMLAATAAAAFAQERPVPPAADDEAARHRATKFHNVEAEIVSADNERMTVTFKADGQEKTAPVSVLARHRLRAVKRGDKVRVSCKDREGQHSEVVSIRPSGAPAKGERPPD